MGTSMITLMELNHSLTKVGLNAIALTRHSTPVRSSELREGLKGLAWMLTEDIQAVDTPARKEARRQLRIETAALLSEIEAALRDPTNANQSAVGHRAKAWNELLKRVQATLGIEAAAALPGARPAQAAKACRETAVRPAAMTAAGLQGFT